MPDGGAHADAGGGPAGLTADFSDVPQEAARHVWITVTRLAMEAAERGKASDQLLRGHWTSVGQWLINTLDTLPGRHEIRIRVPGHEQAASTWCWCGATTDHYENGTEIKR